MLIIGTHPEYWSKDMYYRLKRWVFERGGKLMYLGGNGLNCEVAFLDERTMVVTTARSDTAISRRCKKWAATRAASTRATNRKRICSASYCTDSGIMTAAPYRVHDESHWAFAGTGLRNGDTFGEKCLHMRCYGGASGHETDKRSARFSPPNTQLLAKV